MTSSLTQQYLVSKTDKEQEIKSLIEQYHELGDKIKKELDYFQNKYNESLMIKEDQFFDYFAPLFGDTPDDFKKFQGYFVMDR